MNEGQTDILNGIQELREKAAEHLSGNEYYMVVQQLDTLASSSELDGDLAQAFLSLIRSRLEAGSLADEASSVQPAAASTSGDPEIPSPADTPAEPEPPGSPESPSIPGSPAQPDVSPGPEIPSPPSSPAEPATPPETKGSDGSGDQEQLIAPRANSFGMPQATGAINLTAAEPSGAGPPEGTEQTISETSLSPEPAKAGSARMPNAPPQSALSLAANAARRHIVQHLHGNDYYMAANLLDHLRDLPQSGSDSEAMFPSGNLNAALAVLREQVDSLQGSVQGEAAALMTSLGDILNPKVTPAVELEIESGGGTDSIPPKAASSASATHKAVAGGLSKETVQQGSENPQPASEPVEERPPSPADLSSAPDPFPDPGPRTGFDDLAEAAWHRVKDIDKAERTPPPGLNGSAAPQSVITAAALAEEDARKPKLETPEIVETVAAPEPATAEPMSEDEAEAFNDGGSERRSSEPNISGVEPDIPSPAATASHEPAFKAEIEGWTEARHKAARTSEAEALAWVRTGEGSGTIEMSGDDLEIEEIGRSGSAESTVQDDIQDRMSRRRGEAIADRPSKKRVEKMEEAIEEASGTEAPEMQASQTADNSVPETDSATFKAEDTAAEQTETTPETKPAPDSRGGFWSRLFGLRAAEYR